MVFPHLDEGLHLGDPLLDGLVHPLPSLHVGSILLVRLTKDDKKSAALLVSKLQGGFFNWSAQKMTKCQITCKSLQKSSKCQNFLRV